MVIISLVPFDVGHRGRDQKIRSFQNWNEHEGSYLVTELITKTLSSFFKVTFPVNICNILFGLFYTGLFTGELFCHFWSKLCEEETRNKIFLSPNFFIFWQIDVFLTQSGGEKAAKVCSKSSLSCGLSAHPITSRVSPFLDFGFSPRVLSIVD